MSVALRLGSTVYPFYVVHILFSCTFTSKVSNLSGQVSSTLQC